MLFSQMVQSPAAGVTHFHTLHPLRQTSDQSTCLEVTNAQVQHTTMQKSTSTATAGPQALHSARGSSGP
jgi:hypothetical protein